MSSVRYYNQTAPFWDFIASMEEQGRNHSDNHQFNDNNDNNARESESENEHQAWVGWPAGHMPHRGRHGHGRGHGRGQQEARAEDATDATPPPPEGGDDETAPSDPRGPGPHRGPHGKHHGGPHGKHHGGPRGGPNEESYGSDGPHGKRHGGRHGGPRGGPHGGSHEESFGSDGFHGKHHGGRHGGPRGGPHGGPHEESFGSDGFHGKHHGGPHGGFHGKHHGGPHGRQHGQGFRSSPYHRGPGHFGPLGHFFRHHFNEGQRQNSEDYNPEADVFDTPDSFVVHVALPGAKKEDISVNWDAEKSELSVAGVISRPGDEEFLKTLALDERQIGAFDKKVRLGSRASPAQIDTDAITAKLEDGILVIEVPKMDSGFVEIKKVDIE